MKKIPTKKLEEMIDLQLELNKKFSGENWEEVGREKFALAIITEFAELLESSPENWKWWKPTLKNDKQNQYIEIVDIIHFSLSYMLLDYSKDSILRTNDYINNNEISSIVDSNITFEIFYFLDLPSLQNFYYFINSLLNFTNLSLDKVLVLYNEKNKLNHHRVDNGYMEGKYQKTTDGEEDNRSITI